MYFEREYFKLIRRVLCDGESILTRNGGTKSLFGMQLEIDSLAIGIFPIITSRKIWIKGIVGEMVTFLQGPRDAQHFKENGCNYWEDWADKDGSLRVDYGNKWLDFNGFRQLDNLIKNLIEDPYSRRHILISWDPPNLGKSSLPCCHYAYQFKVEAGLLSLIWIQRSVDIMIGLPSDIILAALLLRLVANTIGRSPGRIIMQLGDCHIYDNHIEGAKELVSSRIIHLAPGYKLNSTVYTFKQGDLILDEYTSNPPLKFEINV